MTSCICSTGRAVAGLGDRCRTASSSDRALDVGRAAASRGVETARRTAAPDTGRATRYTSGPKRSQALPTTCHLDWEPAFALLSCSAYQSHSSNDLIKLLQAVYLGRWHIGPCPMHSEVGQLGRQRRVVAGNSVGSVVGRLDFTRMCPRSDTSKPFSCSQARIADNSVGPFALDRALRGLRIKTGRALFPSGRTELERNHTLQAYGNAWAFSLMFLIALATAKHHLRRSAGHSTVTA